MASVTLYAESVPVEKLVQQGVTEIPQAYVQPSTVTEASTDLDASVPVIDLSGVGTPEGRSAVVQQIQQACQDWGFFQVVNHGVPADVVTGMMNAADDFFNLPLEEKMRYFLPEVNPYLSAYGVRLNERSIVDWRDYFSMGPCHPITEEVVSRWPPSFRSAAITSFCKETRSLGFRLLALISESLGLIPSRLQEVLQDLRQVSLLNRYLPCPQPHLVLALRNHSDPGALTLLLQSGVEGLQVRKNDVWVPVKPVPGSFVINVGDHMQIMTNGRYVSAEHRAVANSRKTRYSIATFLNPPFELEVGPLPELLSQGEKPRYAAISFENYIKTFIAQGADAKASLAATENTA